MELYHLITFECVARERSFSRAAKILNLTQPTVSARLRALEEELGEALFKRNTRHVELTEAGQVFLAYVERTLSLLRQGTVAVHSLREPHFQRLRLATIPSLAVDALATVMEEVLQACPQAKLAVLTGRSREVLDMVVDGVVHVGFLRSPLPRPAPVGIVKLYDDEVVLAVAPSHRLAGAAKVSLRELEGEKLIVRQSNSPFGHWLGELLKAEGVRPQVVVEINHLEATKALVAKGFGVAFLPRSVITGEMEQGVLAGLSIAEPGPILRPTLMIYQQAKRRLPEVCLVREILCRAFPLAEVAPGDTASLSVRAG